MKKIMAVLFTALLLTSCAGHGNDVSESTEISVIPETSVVSEVSRETSKEISKEVSKETSKEASKKVSEVSEQSKEVSEVSEESEIKEISIEAADYSKQLVEKAVDVDELGERTRTYLTNVLESKNLYIDVTGEISLFGGLSVTFDAEVGRSDEGIIEKFRFGDDSVKIIQNGDGTYIIDDKNKKATLAGGAYDPNEELYTSDGYTQNSIANSIILCLSENFRLKSLKYEKSGKEEYKGRLYDFEEYDADGKVVKVYFDGEKPVYIMSPEGKRFSEIEINAFTTEPDGEIFRVPDGYEMVQ